jgi:pimeloyl-ACP methyl ester carboxylesterase
MWFVPFLSGRLPVGSGERMVEVNGVGFCVETFGDDRDPAVLLVMGAAASMLSWEDEFCERLASGGRFAIRYDHRDTGRSVTYAPGAPKYTGDWSDRDAVIDYLVEDERVYAARSRPFDEAARRELAGRIFDRSIDLAASMTNHFVLDGGESCRERLGEIRVPTLVLHGAEDPFVPIGHGRALAGEIPGARLVTLEQTGHELPRATWDVVVPAILEHTSEDEGPSDGLAWPADA